MHCNSPTCSQAARVLGCLATSRSVWSADTEVSVPCVVLLPHPGAFISILRQLFGQRRDAAQSKRCARFGCRVGLSVLISSFLPFSAPGRTTNDLSLIGAERNAAIKEKLRW